ncbi:MAG: MFS transporter [Candidatus Kariarchaeaceae archaeon]|jgi:MFS family permease
MDDAYPTPETSDTPKQGVRKLLKSRDFSSLFIGGLISDIGSYFTYIAVIFLAIAKTDHLSIQQSAQAVAIITVMNIVPSLFIGPFAGVITDRFDRKKLMILADLIGAITSFSFILADSINHIYIIAFFASTTRLFFYPARGASIPVIVDPEDLVSANGLIQTLAQLSGLIGPAFAGILIGIYGLDMAFLIDGISFIVSALFISLIRHNLVPKGANGKLSTKQVLTDLKDGFLIIKNDKIMSFIIITFTFVLIGAGMINPLFAFYLKSEFGLDETDFGLIISFSTITGLVGAIILTSKGQIKRKLSLMMSSVFIIGVALAFLGMAPSLPGNAQIWLYTGMATVGVVNILLNIPFSALMQAIIKNEHLGKVGGFIGTILALAQVIGAGTAAYMAGFIAIDKIFIALSIFFFVIAVFFYGLMVLMNLEEIAQARETEAIELMKQVKLEEETKKKEAETLFPAIETPNINDESPVAGS